MQNRQAWLTGGNGCGLSVEASVSSNDETLQPKKRNRHVSFPENDTDFIHPDPHNASSTGNDADRSRKRVRADGHSDSILRPCHHLDYYPTRQPRQESASRPGERSLILGQSMESTDAKKVQDPAVSLQSGTPSIRLFGKQRRNEAQVVDSRVM